MDFNLTAEQRMIKKMVFEFAERELKPRASDLDKMGRYPRDLILKMGALGLMGMNVPQAYGGAGTDTISYVIAVEEISRCCASTGVVMSVNNSLVCFPLDKWGTEKQKQKYLVPLARGEKVGSFGLTEPNAGSDAASITTTVHQEGDEYILNGQKVFITGGGESEIYIIFATTDRSKGYRGINAYIVEKGTKGFSFGEPERKLGICASPTCSLFFEDCRIPVENQLGPDGKGFSIALATLDAARIGIAAQAVGIARAALEDSIEYSKERVQFGQPIANFQAIQWMLADMATAIDAARLLTYRAAYAKDTQARYTKEAAMAKVFASEVAMDAAVTAVQIHGGYGYTKEHAVERYMRDAKITEIYEGTSEIQRLVIAMALGLWKD